MGTTRTENALKGILGDEPVEIDICLDCGGAYFDRDEYGYMTGDMSVLRVARPVGGPPREVRCPGCDSIMATRRAQGLTFEACPKCGGMFFPGGEIERLL